MTHGATPPEAVPIGPVAYLVSQYPATSHTFIRREVEELRRQGCDIRTFSVRRSHAEDLAGDADHREAASTTYILATSPVRMVAAQLWAIGHAPRRYILSLALALRHRVPGVKALLWSVFHFVEAIVLARALHKARVVRLHNHFANSGASVGMIAAHYLDLRWSLTLHGISETDYPAGVLLAHKIERAEFVACVSWFGRAQAMRLVSPAQWEKFVIVRCGIDMSVIDAIQVAPPRHSGAPLHAICVGRLSPEKGQAGLIEALSTVRRDGHDVRLTLVGDGPDRAMLSKRVAEAGLADVVWFAGRLDERSTLDAIGASDVLISASFMEGLPVVLLEAMALGRPVIAPRVAGIPELVTDSADYLFTPGNWQELAAAMNRLAKTHSAGVAIKKERSVLADEFLMDRAVAPLRQRFAQAAKSIAAAAGAKLK